MNALPPADKPAVQIEQAAEQLTEITPAMSEESRLRAEREAFANAQNVIDGINADTSDPNATNPLLIPEHLLHRDNR